MLHGSLDGRLVWREWIDVCVCVCMCVCVIDVCVCVCVCYMCVCVCVCMAEFLRCSPKTITTLFANWLYLSTFFKKMVFIGFPGQSNG